jgi:hypothetical protein
LPNSKNLAMKALLKQTEKEPKKAELCGILEVSFESENK